MKVSRRNIATCFAQQPVFESRFIAAMFVSCVNDYRFLSLVNKHVGRGPLQNLAFAIFSVNVCI